MSVGPPRPAPPGGTFSCALLGNQGVDCLSDTWELHSVMKEDAEPQSLGALSKGLAQGCIFSDFDKVIAIKLSVCN